MNYYILLKIPFEFWKGSIQQVRGIQHLSINLTDECRFSTGNFSSSPNSLLFLFFHSGISYTDMLIAKMDNLKSPVKITLLCAAL